jgi:RNA polymerase sigma factor (sigma-70 family)
MNADLYATYTKANLPAVLRKFTRDQDVIDEISQSVYLSILERYTGATEPLTVTYVRASAVNRWHDELRHRYRHRRLLDFLERKFDEVRSTSVNSELLDALQQMLSKLPIHYKQVLAFKLKGYDVTATADAMKIERDQARQLRACAMRYLKQQLLRDSN